MNRIKRPSPTHAWLDGFRREHSLEAACLALEQQLNGGRPPLFPAAIARRPFADLWRWSD